VVLTLFTVCECSCAGLKLNCQPCGKNFTGKYVLYDLLRWTEDNNKITK
jgi:hypothetical protein